MDSSFLFHPAQAGRAGEDIALQIEAAILNEKFQPGESLPSERELQTQFQTGRWVIREAIRALKQKGLIEIFHLAGVYTRLFFSFFVCSAHTSRFWKKLPMVMYRQLSMVDRVALSVF